MTIVPSKRWAVRLGAFDGVPGDPDRPKAFVAEPLGKHDGLLTIVQTDYQLSKDSRIVAFDLAAAASGRPGLQRLNADGNKTLRHAVSSL